MFHICKIFSFQLKDDVLAVAAKISDVQRNCHVKMSDISEELRFDLLEVVYEWANGVVCNFLSRFRYVKVITWLQLSVLGRRILAFAK
jgi:superfamily II RNA helicase